MAVSLNLTVGILGELSLGHAGFMSVGAFSGIVASHEPAGRDPERPAASRHRRWSSARIFAAHRRAFSSARPCCRLQGDYLAIVTLAFGEIIKERHQLPHHRLR